MTKNIESIKELKEGDRIGGFYVTAPWDDEDTVFIKEAIVRKFGKELWAEHIKPQYDYTEIKDKKGWTKYLLSTIKIK
jgi:hypothetical protein